MKAHSKVICSINTDDIQTVATEQLGRELAAHEIKLVADKVGDYIPWYDAIDFAIHDALPLAKADVSTD